MKNHVIKIQTKDALPLAKLYFLKTCGIGLETDKHNRMWDRAKQVYEDVSKNLQLQAVLSVFTPSLIEKEMNINGRIFSCNGFEQLRHNCLLRVYAYILTAGDCKVNSDQIVDQLFGDIWGTSFIDAGRVLLREQIESLEKRISGESVLSESFGPGYYGMDVTQVKDLFHVVDPGLIHVTLHKSGLMLPLKSCGGFFLSVKEECNLPPRDCESCIGNPAGCHFCQREPITKE
ncbi:MAG: hypothetical protein PHI32_14395 [Dysgonamonadaceae bacterium]|nr:hypothetical protein [Dysgonamonadaceae bacterium]